MIRTAALFVNSSHGIGPDFSQSGRNGPSIFPATSVSARLRVQGGNRFYFQSAVLDGVPGDPNNPRGTHISFRRGDGLLMAWEGAVLSGASSDGWSSRLADPGYTGKIAVGVWAYTGTYEDVRKHSGPPQFHKGSYGFYVLGERSVYREPGDASQGLSLFARFGVAEPRVNRFAAYTGIGAVYTGPFSRHPEDQIGIAIATAYNGLPYRRDQRMAGHRVDAAEVNIEMSYLYVVSSRITVQADGQLIINPNTDPALRNSVASTLRIQVSL